MTKTIVRRDPFDVLNPFFSFPRSFGDWFGGAEGEGRMIQPAMDVAETEDGLTITAELPGLKKDDVHITLEDGVLSISGEKKFEKEEKEKNYHRVERRYGAFHRSFTLPAGVDASKATASFEDGVLTIALPKTEAAKPRQLKIT
ncbi:MAG: Hsp20/alpha crystallin family protein [Planctomycetota bacterium]|jgi:HSP20 family protein